MLRGYYSPDFVARAALQAAGCSQEDIDEIMDKMTDMVVNAGEYALPYL